VATILIADDDGHIRDVLRFALEKAGHRVVEAADGAVALARCAEEMPDVIVLDIIMPELDGIEVCRRIRQSSSVPILFLSSRDEELDRILGLEMGADDYVTKPFSPREIVARIKAVLRRATGTAEPATEAPLQRGPLILDVQRYRCTWNDQEVVLTVSEFELLRAIMHTPGRVYSRGDLVDRAWGLGHHITERTIDSHVRRIRKKFGDAGADPIETVFGVGYRLRVPGDA
jgi:two-component system OmpR family response regulator